MDRQGIAGRLRGLIGGQEQGDLGAVAARLGVDEVSLRMSIDSLAPYPTMDVLASFVVQYGVDPTWLLTGDYNSGSHRAASEVSPDRLKGAMEDLLRTLQSGPTPGSPDAPTLRLVKDA